MDRHNHYYHLLGKGYIAFTVDPGNVENRYQGIVELTGESIVDAVQHYFSQSEQIKTSIKLAIHPQDGQFKATALMIQQMPDENAGKMVDEQIIEDWTRAVMLMSTCSEEEMLSPLLHSADILYRLFHEDGVRVYSPTHVRFKCRCSKERVINILKTIPRKEIEDICRQDGKISIKCEFCSEDYVFMLPQIEDIFGQEKK